MEPTREITCVVGALNVGLEVSPDMFTLDGMTIEGVFREVFCCPDGAPAIALRLQGVSLGPLELPRGEPVTPLHLHEALRRVTGNPSRPGVVERIGLVCAARYEPVPAALGIMFDRGSPTCSGEPVPSWYRRVPREGCAVFVETIRELRSEAGTFREELFFTAIHELGHVFNLWHIEVPENFMTPSRPDRVYPREAFRFLPEHRDFLRRGAGSRHVRPGGSRFGERGPSRLACVPRWCATSRYP